MFRFELERCDPHKAARHSTRCDVINDFKQFPMYIAGYNVANFDVIQSDVALEKQVR